MGLFENLGRKVEKFKQQAQDASRERATARCADCGTDVYTDREDCPDCGSGDLVALTQAPPEPNAEAESGPESESEPEPEPESDPDTRT